ncbi:MAG TPA: hypothetical protein VFD94_07455 [Jatrophihabitans sp.]|jgi:hypothetical protein|nr:hypothetical protein [Jatrophihabitans sp.]
MTGHAGRRLLVGVLAAGLLAGCHPGSATPSGSASQPAGLGGGSGEQTQPSTAPRSTILTTPRPSLSTPHGVKEVDGSCPYISSQAFANGEGDRVGRVTVLQTKPVGCRFYFQYDDSAVIGEIDLDTFATATQAYNAMVLSAKGHPEVQSDPAIGNGAVAFQRDLQGTRTWQCVFAKGTVVVTVRTRQPDPALNAFNLAREIAPKIH